jgi:hypothetical protein
MGREAVNLALPVGWLLFFFVPIALWLAGTAGSYQVGKTSSLLTIIIGTDNRLSLSRLQAFAWTLVIFGA